MKKNLLISLLVFSVLLVIWSVAQRNDRQESRDVDWKTRKVVRGDIATLLTGRGKVNPERILLLQPNQRTTIQEILVREGDLVKKGACLVKLEPDLQLDIEFNTTRQKFLVLREEKKGLEETLAFKRKLVEEGLAAQFDLNELEQRISVLGVEIDILNNRRILLEKKLGRKSKTRKVENADSSCLYAPFAGTVLEINKIAGEFVSPRAEELKGTDTNAAILVLADLSEYQVEFEISELDLQKLRTGQQVAIKFDYHPDGKCLGTVQKISSVANEERRPWGSNDQKQGISYYDVSVSLGDCAVPLKPGLSCRVEIAVERHEQVLLVPLETVVKEGGEQSVFVLRVKEFQRQAINTGLVNETMVEVTAGLTEADLICENPLQFMEHLELQQQKRQRSWLERVFQ